MKENKKVLIDYLPIFDVDTPFTFNNMMMLQVARKTVEARCFCAIKWLVAVVISSFINFNPSTISA